MVKKIGIITGTRAEYGLLRPLMQQIMLDDKLELQVFVTGMHLSPEFGLTYKYIEEDGYTITEKIEMLLSSDTEIGISKSIGLGVMGFAEAYARHKPDLIVVLGDRYETFAAATAAMIAKIPIAHIHGGEITEGAVDDAIRHSISKMSYLHFTSTEAYRQRVIQLGEHPERVFHVGAMGVENIKSLELYSKSELEERIGFDLTKDFALVTFHPVTLENETAKEQFNHLLEVLSKQKFNVIFTKANADADGRIINQMIDEYVAKYPERYKAFVSMGQLNYLSAMQYCTMVIGNSSSGIIEAPSFNIPTINIGDRQKGRVMAKTVINCKATKEEIAEAIKQGLSTSFREQIKAYHNPYEKEDSSKAILKIIKETLETDKITLKKGFYDIERE